ncbi:hypothetical protein MAR_019500 [Mya arenaria]|uniref:Sulfotransferase n=1 Tax=Mya arenaria TaxID=6604 RepID=A0ABY7E594_MYAAR|nr:hypothetical protein MAR_019500 [Mya arenaria]
MNTLAPHFNMRGIAGFGNVTGYFQVPAVLGRSRLTGEALYTGKETSQVLLLTYMRSGSSLTGDILQHSPGAFYIYEPFRSLGHKNKSSYILNYANVVDYWDNVTSLLLLTYMRSGSSLAGDILQQAQESFYLYEPLHSVEKALVEFKHLSMATPDKSHRLPPLEFNSEAAEELYNWFTCDIPKLPNIALLDSFMSK